MALTEAFANEAATTLNGAITSSATSATVSSGTGFPTSVPFRVRISGNLTAGGTGTEYALVTAVNGTGWTITRGVEAPYNSGLGFASGASVRHVVTTMSLYEVPGWVNVRNPRFAGGAKGDGVTRTTGSMTSGSAVLTDSGATFTPADVGKYILVQGTGTTGGTLTSTILSRQSNTQVTLANNASTTVSGTASYDYGTDDAAAINAALTYAASLGTSNFGTGTVGQGIIGGTVFAPPGVYLHSASLAIPSRVKLKGAGRDATTFRRTADVAGITASGTGTSDANRNWFASLEDCTIDGNDKWVQGFEAVYCSQFSMSNVFIYNVHHIGIDLVEVWDSSFFNIFLQFCGGIAVTEQPSVYVRSTRAASGFGFSTDTVNEVKFTNLHTEHFRAGAIKIGPGFAGATNGPNGIYFTNIKCETAYVSNTTPFIQIDPNTERIHIKNVYTHAASFQDGSAINVINNQSIGQTTIRDVQVTNGGNATIANGVNINISGSGMAVVDGVYGQYGTAPTGATVNVAAAGDMEISNVRTNLGTRISNYEIDSAARMLAITADATTTATSAANLASMTFSSVPTGTYRLEFEGMHRSSTTSGGLAFGIGGTSSATGTGALLYGSASTTLTGVEMTAISTTFRGANAGATATSYYVRATFIAVVSAGGTLGLRWNMSTSGTGTLRAGSQITMTRVR